MTDVVTKSFRGRDPVAEELSLSAEAEAALRQFSPERIVAYGVVQADMVELRGRVAQGEEWRRVCMDLAATALAPPESAVSPATPRTEANRLYRASAMIRMAQVMMIEDTDERRGIYEEAAELHARASEIAGGVERVLIDTPRGPVAGWYHRPRDVAPLGGVVVIGGVEGWAMDFAALGAALASRGVAAMVVDGPGQGETRLVHGHFLSRDWPSAYRAVVDELVDRVGNAPVGFVGNSLGGTVALRYAAIDARMAVVCDNGGPLDPGLARANSSFFRKMVAHCGRPSEDEAQAIWRTILPPSPGRAATGRPARRARGDGSPDLHAGRPDDLRPLRGGGQEDGGVLRRRPLRLQPRRRQE